MAENVPTPPPPGGLPPRPSDAAKVQPRKETVRINLPPKPTASATIKLPTLPAGGPPPPTAAAPAPAAAPRPTMPPPPPGAAPKPPAPPTGGGGAKVAGPPTAAKPAGATVAPGSIPPPPTAARKPAAAPVAAISGVDKGLAVAAAVVSIVALGSVVYLGWFLLEAAV